MHREYTLPVFLASLVIQYVIPAIAANTFGITFDKPAYAKGFILFTSIVTVTNDATTITDEILAQVAGAAWKEMNTTFTDQSGLGRNRNRPTVMAALLADDQIFLASSLKGSESFLSLFPFADHPDSPEISKALNRCGMYIMEDSSKPAIRHVGRANCGEMAALHLWTLANKDRRLGDVNNLRIVAVASSNSIMSVKPPCGRGAQNILGWGCSQALASFKIADVDKGDSGLQILKDPPEMALHIDFKSIVCNAGTGSNRKRRSMEATAPAAFVDARRYNEQRV